MRVGSFFKGTLRESSAHLPYSGDVDKNQLGSAVVPRELNALGIHELDHVAVQLYPVVKLDPVVVEYDLVIFAQLVLEKNTCCWAA